MKTQSVALAEFRRQTTTTFAWCWKCTRLDGVIFGFTTCDQSFIFEGVEYEAATGFTPSDIEAKLDMSVPNLECTGMLDSESITENDLLGGKWDGARVDIFEVNYRDLSMGRMWLGGGTIGNVTAGRQSFNAELRGRMQALQQPIGTVYTETCTAIFGDDKCKYDVEALRVSGTVDAVTNRASFGTAMAQADDYFGAGLLTWLTGLNAGISMEVAAFESGDFVLHQAMPFNIAAGDTFTVIPGCRKRRDADCMDKWNNVINFRGFPDMPLNDKVLGQAGLSNS